MNSTQFDNVTHCETFAVMRIQLTVISRQEQHATAEVYVCLQTTDWVMSDGGLASGR